MTDTVLVVDDSTFIVEGLVALLKRTYRAIPSFGGEECLQILLTETPSVIILDIMMEPMDGWETLSRIKDNPRTKHIPVLMFSAKQISFEEADAHRIRIDDFLTKPVSPKELLSAIARILERQDRKKHTLACWTARGIPPETIDQYLTLSSNLEIDTSLLSVMKKHLDHPSITDLRREELTSSVQVLEERIRGTESLIGKFFSDTGLSLPGDSDPVDLPPPADGIPPCPPPGTHPGEGTGTGDTGTIYAGNETEFPGEISPPSVQRSLPTGSGDPGTSAPAEQIPADVPLSAPAYGDEPSFAGDIPGNEQPQSGESPPAERSGIPPSAEYGFPGTGGDTAGGEPGVQPDPVSDHNPPGTVIPVPPSLPPQTVLVEPEEPVISGAGNSDDSGTGISSTLLIPASPSGSPGYPPATLSTEIPGQQQVSVQQPGAPHPESPAPLPATAAGRDAPGRKADMKSPGPVPPRDTGSSGKGLLAIILRLFFRG